MVCITPSLVSCVTKSPIAMAVLYPWQSCSHGSPGKTVMQHISKMNYVVRIHININAWDFSVFEMKKVDGLDGCEGRTRQSPIGWLCQGRRPSPVNMNLLVAIWAKIETTDQDKFLWRSWNSPGKGNYISWKLLEFLFPEFCGNPDCGFLWNFSELSSIAESAKICCFTLIK